MTPSARSYPAQPAKYAQRVRACTTSSNPVVFKCEMDEGHTGAMDRYKYIKDRAFELAWALHCLKVPIKDAVLP